MIGRLLNKLRKSYSRRGLRGTVVHAINRASQRFLELTPTWRRSMREKAERDQAFDSRHGVDTGGIIQLNSLQIAGTSWQNGTSYWAIDPAVFARLVGTLAIHHQDFTFIDFGSGKGRAVLLASEFPFKSVIGVEFSPELDQVARENLAGFRSERQQCWDMRLVCADALQYPLPHDPLVCYFFNPFGREVMARVAERIAESYQTQSREIYILYANPQHAVVWQQNGCFQQIAATPDFAIFKTHD
ncbi:MAG: class I SAM-dependent methyltransferase [Planctomycetes bacterium]|nr:class I SAM-dependent methyltransferase [Planctomycetota bacterium]